MRGAGENAGGRVRGGDILINVHPGIRDSRMERSAIRREALGLRTFLFRDVYDIRELDILFQSLLGSRRDCGAITVTRIQPIKHQSRVARLRIRIALEGRTEYFTVVWGTPRELQIVEANSPHPSYRGYTLHLAAVAYPGSFWDRILDRLPWLEKVAKPLWEIIKLALKFVPMK